MRKMCNSLREELIGIAFFLIYVRQDKKEKNKCRLFKVTNRDAPFLLKYPHNALLLPYLCKIDQCVFSITIFCCCNHDYENVSS